MKLIDTDALKRRLETMIDRQDDEITMYGFDTEYHNYHQTLKKAYQEIINIIDKMSANGGWISVKDRLPENYSHVLTYSAKEDYVPYIWLGDDRWNKITHWMPLPEPPDELADVSEEIDYE